LKELGISAHHIAQEHSFVPEMWQRLVKPDVLIYLDVSYDVSMRRRPLNLSPQEFSEQVHRLRHAREHADLYLMTDDMTIPQVLQVVRDFLEKGKLSS
jgi:thymidylate kinase